MSVSTNRRKWLTTGFGNRWSLIYFFIMEGFFMEYDVIIIGAGPGGIFSAYELTKKRPELKIAVLEAGHGLDKRRCPIDGEKVKACVKDRKSVV